MGKILNLFNSKIVHVITWQHREYDRRATMLEVEQFKSDPYCKVLEDEDGSIILDFRRL